MQFSKTYEQMNGLGLFSKILQPYLIFPLKGVKNMLNMLKGSFKITSKLSFAKELIATHDSELQFHPPNSAGVHSLGYNVLC